MPLAGKDWKAALQKYAPRWDLTKGMTPAQQRIHRDKAFSRVIWGSRRSGKTEYYAAAALLSASRDEEVPIIGPTAGKVRDILFPKFRELDKRHAIGLRFNLGRLRVTTPDGGVLQVYGLGSRREAEKLRGQEGPAAFVTECGVVASEVLQYAIEDCLEPSMARFFGTGRGILCEGTPSIALNTWWHEKCQGLRGDSVHHITGHDNSYIPNWAEYLEFVLKKNGWTRQTPKFIREYLGQFCLDSEGLCYAAHWNGVELPRESIPQSGRTLMMLDIGYDDPCAWVILRVYEDRLHVIDYHLESGLTVHQVADISRKLRRMWGVGRMVADGAGVGKLTVESLRKNHGLPFTSVAKPGDKRDRIYLTQGLLSSGSILVYEPSDGRPDLPDQLRNVGWDRHRKDHDPDCVDDLCDALHGAVTEAQQWRPEAETPPDPEEARRRARREAAFARARRR
jgi:hypothetical protein